MDSTTHIIIIIIIILARLVVVIVGDGEQSRTFLVQFTNVENGSLFLEIKMHEQAQDFFSFSFWKILEEKLVKRAKTMETIVTRGILMVTHRGKRRCASGRIYSHHASLGIKCLLLKSILYLKKLFKLASSSALYDRAA
jgi:hypothetical protein